MSYDHTINKQRQMVKVKVAVRQADDNSQAGDKKTHSFRMWWKEWGKNYLIINASVAQVDFKLVPQCLQGIIIPAGVYRADPG